MASQDGNVLPAGTFALEFGMKLHGYTTDLSDDNQHRLAVHEYDRVAGAEVEWMQRGPWKTNVTLVFLGAAGFADALKFQQLLEENPKRLLIHPVYGRRRAACSGAVGARLAAQEPNVYTMPVTFQEDSLRGSVIGEGVTSVSGSAASVTAQATAVNTLADPFGGL